MAKMIKIVEGDLLGATEDIIGHQVNCSGVMGSGVAKQLRDKYEGLYQKYKTFCNYHTKQELLGKCLFVVSGEKVIANIFGQMNFGYDGQRYTDYDGLRSGLCHVKDFAMLNNLSIAIPYKIGSDRGGADWNEVYKIIDDVFVGYEVTLYKL